LLRKCFPPSDVVDTLMVGMPVRDTCVVPIYKDEKSEKRGNSNQPRGYTFSSSSFKVDSWMLPYKRVTLPVFELIFDPVKCADAVTNQHASIFTPNGRVPLTPDQYYEATLRLQSSINVPLFDAIPKQSTKDDRHKNNPYFKRRETAKRRCQEWLDHFVSRHRSRSSEETNSVAAYRIWAPIAVDQKGDSWTDQVYRVRAVMEDEATSSVDGVAVIGWEHIDDTTKRRSLIKSIRSELRDAKGREEEEPTVAVLSTHSLSHVLDAASSGCSIVGSDLPGQWSRSHRAFIVDFTSWRSATTSFDKKARIESNHEGNVPGTILDENGCIDLSPPAADEVTAHAWFRDASALVEGCSCLTCTTHTRAYVYHLVCAKELLGEMLLFIHNLHRLLQFFRQVNRALREGEERSLVEHIESQLTGKEGM